MKSSTSLSITILTHLVLFAGISPILPARAQDEQNGQVQVHGRVIIRTPDGEQVIDLDPSQLPPPGEGNHVLIMRAGPNGEITTFSGDPGMLNLNGGGALAYSLPGSSGAGSGTLSLNAIDPGVSYLYALLKRIDVAQEIHLNARQREALEAAENSQQEARKEQLQQSVQVMTQSLQGKSPEELKATLAERGQKMQEQAKTFTDSRLKTLAEVLRPEQLARLRELDLQFRGPLAMGISDVAEKAALNKDQVAGVAALLKEYRQEVRKNLSFGMRTISLKQGSAAPPPPVPNSEEMRVKLVKADREIRKSRQALGAKALASLPEAQRAQWTKISGKAFEFHPAL